MASRTLDALVRRDPRIEGYDDERGAGNGYLVYTADGFCWGIGEDGTHTRGFDTVREVLARVPDITPCSGRQRCCPGHPAQRENK